MVVHKPMANVAQVPSIFNIQSQPLPKHRGHLTMPYFSKSSFLTSISIKLHLNFRSYHCNEMQQIHARLVGFGVSQFEQR